MSKDDSNWKRTKVYVHREKESNYNLATELGIEEGSEAEQRLAYLGYEVELTYDINVSTGEARLVGAGGFFLDTDQKISDGEHEVVES